VSWVCLRSKRRNRLQVAREILGLALDGANATSIVSGAKLTFASFEKHVDDLVARGLLAVDDRPRLGVYRTTEKGRKLLELLNEVGDLL
jgi:predicted transcriptional regulator